MNRRLGLLALLAAFLTIAGCGSSTQSSPSTAQSATGSTTIPAPSTSDPTAAGVPSTTSNQPTTTTTAAGGTAGSSSGGASVSGSTGGSTAASRSAGGSTNARVPATFKVIDGGRLRPPFVYAPAFLAVRVTVVSSDGKDHKAVLMTPTPHSLSVPAKGRASVQVPGLRAGEYRLEIDGTMRGGLMIGGEPGP